MLPKPKNCFVGQWLRLGGAEAEFMGQSELYFEYT